MRTVSIIFAIVAAIFGASVPAVHAAPHRPHRGVVRCGVTAPAATVQNGIEAEIAVFKMFSAEALSAAARQPLIRIPVAIHIIQNTQGDNTVTEGAITQQIARLNAAFAGAARFTLVLADEVVNDSWFSLQVGSRDDEEMRAALRVGDGRTLNIYLNEPYLYSEGDLLGIAQFPWELSRYPAYDGVVLRYATLPGGDAAPYNKGKTAVHEVGHWLGLLHTFEPPNPERNLTSSNNGCKGRGDRIADTPAERDAHYACRITDSCSGGGRDPIHNFMNYTTDACLRTFTANQRTRIRAMWSRYRG